MRKIFSYGILALIAISVIGSVISTSNFNHKESERVVAIPTLPPKITVSETAEVVATSDVAESDNRETRVLPTTIPDDVVVAYAVSEGESTFYYSCGATPTPTPSPDTHTPTKHVSEGYAPTFPYDDYDIRCLAVAMYREAGGERGEGAELCMMMVGNVIINRAMYKGDFPNTIQDVLKQKNQYPWANRVGFHFPDDVSKEERQYFCGLAKRLLDGERVCPYNVTFQAEFKMQRHGNPSDAKVFKYFGFKKKSGRVSKYYFCYY